jgi:hypothetical protein
VSAALNHPAVSGGPIGLGAPSNPIPGGTILFNNIIEIT